MEEKEIKTTKIPIDPRSAARSAAHINGTEMIESNWFDCRPNLIMISSTLPMI